MEGRKIAHIVLPVTDRAKAADFYKNLFGWDSEAFDDYTACQTGSENVKVGLQDVSLETRPGVPVIYFDSNDIDADLEAVKSKGGVIVKEKSPMGDYGEMGAFLDPFGNVLCLLHEFESKSRKRSASGATSNVKKSKVDNALKTEFESMTKRVKEEPNNMPSNDELLNLYALYKQAKYGNVTGKRPGFTKVKDRYMWDSWKKLENKSSEECMKEYIAYATSIIEKYK